MFYLLSNYLKFGFPGFMGMALLFQIQTDVEQIQMGRSYQNNQILENNLDEILLLISRWVCWKSLTALVYLWWILGETIMYFLLNLMLISFELVINRIVFIANYCHELLKVAEVETVCSWFLAEVYNNVFLFNLQSWIISNNWNFFLRVDIVY